MPVQRTLMAPPRCRIGAITQEERATVRGRSPAGVKYDTRVNRESAYEMLQRKTADQAPATPAAAPTTAKDANNPLNDWLWGKGRRQGMVEAMAKQAARTVGSQIGRQVLRGILGGLTRSSR